MVVFSFLARLLGGSDVKNPFTLPEEIQTMMQMPSSDGDIEPIEQNMIRRLFNFGETTAHEVMTPLIDLAMVEQSAKCSEAGKIAMEHSHARILVYNKRVDRIIGVLDILQLLGVAENESIQPFIRQIAYIPGGKNIQNLLVDMRRSREQVTVVVDELGGAEGIVSIEDILEEVVEEIQDEYDSDEDETQLIQRQDDGTLLVNTRIDLSDLSRELGIELPKGRYSSLAGFLLEKAGEIPPVGSTIKYKKFKFTILRGSAQSIQKVRIN